jgi:hypothetical protein
MSDKEITKRQSVDIEARDALLNSSFTGFEGMTDDMLSLAFLKLAQDKTKQLDNRREKGEQLEAGRIAGLKPGYFFSSQTGTVFKGKVKFIPIFIKSGYNYWGAKEGNWKGEHTKKEVDDMVSKGILFPNDGKPGWHDKEQIEDRTGKCCFAITVYCFLPDYPTEGLIPFVGESRKIKHLKNFISLVNGMKIKVNGKILDKHLFHHVCQMTGVLDKSDSGYTNYNIGNDKGSTITFVGSIFEPEYAAILPKLKETVDLVEEIKAGKIKVDMAGSVDEDGITDDAAEGKNEFED